MKNSLKSIVIGLVLSVGATSLVAADPYAADRQALKDSAEAVSVEKKAVSLSTRNVPISQEHDTLKGYGGR